MTTLNPALRRCSREEETNIIEFLMAIGVAVGAFPQVKEVLTGMAKRVLAGCFFLCTA